LGFRLEPQRMRKKCGSGLIGSVCRKESRTVEKDVKDGDLEDVSGHNVQVSPTEDVARAEEVDDRPLSARSGEDDSLLKHCPDRLSQQCPDVSHLLPHSTADICSSDYRARLAVGCNARVAAMVALPVAFVLVSICALISFATGAALVPTSTTTTTTTTSTTKTTTVTSTHTIRTVTTTGTSDLPTSCSDTPGWPCLGKIHLKGHGLIHIISAGANRPDNKIGATGISHCNQVSPYKQGRVYFGESCSRGTWSNSDYTAINFLGKILRFSVDLSKAQCGCVAALYLVNMRQNTDPGLCGRDYYCDASRICGVACAEVDLMEANRNMYKVTLHNSSDKDGRQAAFDIKYGPGNKCINTEKAFNVRSSISYDGSSVTVNLEQGGCTIEETVTYSEMSVPFWAGMTPVISYWYNDKPGSMTWFDGKVCKKYNPKHACGENVLFSNFSLSGSGDMLPV